MAIPPRQARPPPPSSEARDVVEIERVYAGLPGTNTDEIIVVLAVFVVLFLAGLTIYMANAIADSDARVFTSSVYPAEVAKDAAPLVRPPVKLASAFTKTSSKRIRHRPFPEPVLLCAIVAPGRLPSGAKDTSWVPWRHLPAHGVCDYIILDTDVNPDGSYNESEYSFLRNYDTTAKLFTLAARPFHQLRATFRELPFLGSAAVLRRTMRVRGFGLLDGDSGTAGSAVTDGAIRDTVRLFSELKKGLVSAGYEEYNIVSFLGLRPVHLRRYFLNFSNLLKALDGRVRFLILLSLSASRRECVVEAPSAWDANSGCFVPDGVQPTMQDCLELIASVERPTSRFALTLSLRIDVFLDADLSNGDTEGVQGNGIFGSRCYGHTHQYVPQHSCPDAEEPDDESTSDEAAAECNLRTSISQKEWRVHTFETPTSIENKMIRAYRRLGPSKQRLLSWLIYNVTSYVADGPCPKGRTRIDRIRDVIQRFRH